ncbi:MAG: class I SAM-dependent methyltransferase [Ruminococcus sp.]|uniref:class I SAM-dependent methyltransferase n=1 Tax=Ruminococcus sp. TaxID=41978 RepID=UPI0025F87161|nr:class I SAM-dependent methyltransferase [Ruminococcus sp.]MCR5600482.1 class I SAM-dependent methyltransferase [Ruminococcus sp.]
MSNISQFLDKLKKQQGLKGAVKRKLFGLIFEGLEAVEKDIGALEKSVRDDLENACINLRNNNARIERLTSDDELIKTKLSGMEKKLRSAPMQPAAPSADQPAASAAPADSSGSDYDDIDYFDFENHFRGSIDSVKKSQEFYLKFFSGKKKVVDVGCGRGEFLLLMQENGITAEGVDIYEPYTDYCNMKGLKATCGDGSEFLAKTEGVDGIFVGQVVEHLKPYQIIQLCNTAYERLENGGCIVIETPNPTSLSIYTNAFYIDPSHIKPVHPLTMQYYLEKAGFTNIEIIFTENSRPPFRIPALKCESAENTEEFNAAMKQVSDMIFGSQDYAIVAIKEG